MGADVTEGLAILKTLLSFSVAHIWGPGIGHYGKVSLFGLVLMFQSQGILTEVLPQSILMPIALCHLPLSFFTFLCSPSKLVELQVTASGGTGTPSPDTGAEHCTHASSLSEQGPLPTSCHWRSRPAKPGQPSTLTAPPARLRPRGGGREETLLPKAPG